MITDFRALPLAPALLEVVAELGFETLTPVQAESIPVLLAGKDLIGQSKTGSGKTAAFALPMLHRLEMRSRALKGLVICPTRELSAQVAREMRKLGRRHPGLQVLVLAGGEPLRPQASALERGAHLAVGTPGRILDHLRRDILDLSQLDTIVLDEADRMLEMGFQQDIEEIMASAPKRRQTVLFSATFPRSIESMSHAYQTNPARITIAEDTGDKPDIAQRVMFVEPEQKMLALRFILGQHPHESALIFCNFKAGVTALEQTLSRVGMSVGSLHGDLEQYDRDQVMAKFRNASTRILVATDVAARGLDVKDLDLVVNYDLPSQPEVYVHRIGRTGRAGKSGVAVSLATERERSKLRSIEALTQAPIETISLRSDTEQLEVAAPSQELARDAKMDTLQISGGRKEKVRPGDILGALTGEAGKLEAAQVGKIEIHDHFSYVAVARTISEVALERLREGRIKGRKFRVRRVA
jgi:ATP-independent RNA helicase DbpA